MDFGMAAQAAAEAHLQACMDALDANDAGVAWESPASAPFCGCDTCCVRETLYAAWPFALQEQAAEIERLDGEWKDALASLNVKLAAVLEQQRDPGDGHHQDQPPDGHEEDR